MKQFNEKILKTKDQDAAKNKDGVKAPLPPNLPLPPLPQDKKFATPIIIVPNAVTSYINVVNAEDFLMKGKFIPVDQYGNKREKMKVATRVMPNGEMATYKIIDDGDKLKDSDWDRVVAVFATGKMWQFKTWKYNNPVDLFQQVLGVHLTYEDRVVDPNILSWNCKVLKVIPDIF